MKELRMNTYPAGCDRMGLYEAPGIEDVPQTGDEPYPFRTDMQSYRVGYAACEEELRIIREYGPSLFDGTYRIPDVDDVA